MIFECFNNNIDNIC